MAEEESAGEVTLLLRELKGGDKAALEKLIPLVYGELRLLARACLQAERAGHTLQPTALVHELYLRLVNQDHADWKDRAHFLAIAAQLMRRILVDYARSRRTSKRAGVTLRIGAGGLEPEGAGLPIEEILTVDRALDRLAELDRQQARIVELRYFGGLTVEEASVAVGVSERTVKRDWAMANAWLRTEFSARPSV